jgi:hypothetical protein
MKLNLDIFLQRSCRWKTNLKLPIKSKHFLSRRR